MTQYLQDSIFWIEVEKIQPNPYQPRREFDQNALQDLSDSIRQYGVLQPLVVTRKEEAKEGGEGIRVLYELIAGERRLRASKLAGIAHVPAVIRAEEEDPRAKLELAIIENLQREDLNPIDRARAFARLVEEFGFKHAEVAKKVGRSREYISNSLRLLDLPEEIMQALRDKKITEGHARTMMMLSDRPDEQKVLFKEIVYKKLSVREAEGIAREIAHDKVRKKKNQADPETTALEGKLSNTLGTRVHIKRKENGGKLVIDFFSDTDLEDILTMMESNQQRGSNAFMDRFIEAQEKLQEQAQAQEQEGEKEQAREESEGQVPEEKIEGMDKSEESEPLAQSQDQEKQEKSEGLKEQDQNAVPENLPSDFDSHIFQGENTRSQDVADNQAPEHHVRESGEENSDPPQKLAQEPENSQDREENKEDGFDGMENTPQQAQEKPVEEHSVQSEQETEQVAKPEEKPLGVPQYSNEEAFEERDKRNDDDENDLYSVKNFTI